MSDSHGKVTTLIYPEYCGQLSRKKKNSVKDTDDSGERERKKKDGSEQRDFRNDQFSTQT